MHDGQVYCFKTHRDFRRSLGSDVVFGFLLTLPALASYAPFMPRRLRIEYEDAIYHVMTRGNARQDIVHDGDDRRRLIANLERVVDRSDWVVLGFVIMSNHLHLLLRTPVPNLARGIQSEGKSVSVQFFQM
jgi:hypothetical protein